MSKKNSAKVSEALIRITEEALNMSNCDLASAKTAADELLAMGKGNAVIAWLEHFDSFQYISARFSHGFHNLIKNLMLNRPLKDLFAEALRAGCPFSNILRKYYYTSEATMNRLSADSVDASVPLSERVAYCFMNDAYADFIYLITTNSKVTDISDYATEAATAYMLRHFRPSVELKSRMRAHLLNAGYEGAVSDCLLAFFSPEEKRELYFDPKCSLPVTADIFRSFTKEQQLKAVATLTHNEDALKAIENDFSTFFAAAPQAVTALCEDLACVSDNVLTERILKNMKKLPDSEYFMEYLVMLGRRRFSSSAFPNGEQCSVDREKLLKYFVPQFDARTNFRCDGYLMEFRLNSLSGHRVVSFTENESGHREADLFLLSGKTMQACGDILHDYILTDCPELSAEKMADVIHTLEEHRKEEELRAFRSDMKKLCSIVDKNTILLSDRFKAVLEFAFTFPPDEYRMSMKIGTESGRKYVVQDAAEFLSLFENKEEKRYGKGLELTHTLENFEPASAAALDLLLTAGAALQPVSYDKRQLQISSRLAEKLLLLFKGRTVNIDGEAFVLTLRELSPSVSVDAEHKLSFTPGQGISDDHFLLMTDSMLFIFDRSRACADVIRAGAEKLALYCFAAGSNGVDVSLDLPEFLDNVYTRFSGEIDVDESLRDEFRLSELTINTYFDFENNCILYHDEFLKGHSPVAREALTSHADSTRIAQYERYLENIGFSDRLMKDDADVLAFFRMDFAPLKRFCNVYLSDNIQNKQLTVFSQKTIRVQYNNDIMSAFLAESEYSEKELEAIYKAIRRKKKYLFLSGNRIVALDNDAAAEFHEAVDDLALDPAHLYREKELSMVSALKALAHENSCSVDDYLRNMISELRDYKSLRLPLPELNAELRPYQQECYNWLKTLVKYRLGGILADDMGLGKTLEIIALIASDDAPEPSLIVCPKSLIFNWKNEFARFAPGEKTVEIYGSAKRREDLIASIQAEEKVIYITAYDSLRNDAALYASCNFAYMILDEAQYIKNVEAQKSKNVKSVPARHRFALTGTPIENNIIDLWSIFDFIMPGYLPDLNRFRSAESNDDKFLATLAAQTGPFILRRRKEDVLQDLPDKFERIVTAEMPPEQRMIYDSYVLQARAMLEEGGKAFDMLPYLMRLRQICVDPSTFIADYHGSSAKFAWLRETLPEYISAGHRILIFSQFVKGLHVVEDMLQGMHTEYFKITGDTASEERIGLVNAFNAGNIPVFLLSLKAGGTGLNLTGADVVIHLDPWWNAAAEDQATDRAHRIGQTRNVEVIKLICEDSVEQRVIELQNIKKDIIDKVISADDERITNASLEDIAFILGRQ